MVFSSSVFLFCFLPIVFISNYLIKNKYSNLLLLIASLLFYAWGEPQLVFLMIFSVVINWLIGLGIFNTKGMLKNVILILGLVIDLGILGYYKYAGFFATCINSLCTIDIIPVLEITLPIGISFFTFQSISYIVDVYRGDTKASNKVTNVALYIAFFPQLIAGPIVKYKDINRQIEERNIEWISVSKGFRRFIYGLGKKVLISNVLGQCVDIIYTYNIESIDIHTAWIGALAYTFQIYYDFSGYSDMAIGLGKMFGFTILENFEYPYMSRSISEFWRRWHISLGTWFREYVYIPVGGNRKGKTRMCLNLLLVFFLTGLWHGADMSFVFWGLFHGVFSIFERVGFKKILDKFRIISVIYTFILVNFGWVLFRANDTITGLRYIATMVTPWKSYGLGISVWEYLNHKTIFAFACAIIGMGFLKYFIPQKIQKIWKDSVIEALYCVGILILCLASIASDTYNPFIYFQF